MRVDRVTNSQLPGFFFNLWGGGAGVRENEDPLSKVVAYTI